MTVEQAKGHQQQQQQQSRAGKVCKVEAEQAQQVTHWVLCWQHVCICALDTCSSCQPGCQLCLMQAVIQAGTNNSSTCGIQCKMQSALWPHALTCRRKELAH